jgi:preprotein translocase subunit YajC
VTGQQINWQELAPPVLLMVAMLAMFWFIVVKPAKRRQQRHVELVDSVQEGEQIVTVGGIYGKVVKLREESVDLEVAPNVKLRLDRRALRRRQGEKDEP